MSGKAFLWERKCFTTFYLYSEYWFYPAFRKLEYDGFHGSSLERVTLKTIKKLDSYPSGKLYQVDRILFILDLNAAICSLSEESSSSAMALGQGLLP